MRREREPREPLSYIQSWDWIWGLMLLSRAIQMPFEVHSTYRGGGKFVQAFWPLPVTINLSLLILGLQLLEIRENSWFGCFWWWNGCWEVRRGRTLSPGWSEYFPSTSGLACLPRDFASVPRDFSNSSNVLSERELQRIWFGLRDLFTRVKRKCSI